MPVKERNPWFVVVASILTFFIYALYWFYSTSKELIELTKSKSSAVLWLIGLFIPFVNLYVIWKYCEAAAKISEGRRDTVLLFIVWIIFVPLAMFWIQSDINKYAK
ncbi:DUF4234 domain-containing protein [Candidatus Micrarchaeota archaeon]|nr:DUF4234 domain-containing protein [Candidatus Micrarchaeota archaeon]